ncbi:MAG: TerB family tellurite resistance protein [Roseinatronobacter sp.]
MRPAPPDHRDDDIRVAALLVRVARADGDYSAAEQGLIDTALTALLGVAPAQATALREAGEELDRVTGDTVHLTRRVKDRIALADRPALLRAMWRIILSDNARHEEEDGFMRLVTNLLGLADRDSALARQDVQVGR